MSSSSSEDEAEKQQTHREKQPQKGGSEQAPGKREPYNIWNKISRHKLCQGVSDQLDSSDSMPWDQFKIDWSKVSVEGVSEEKCAAKWALMVNQVRHYRTMAEIVSDVKLLHRTEDSTAVSKWNKASSSALTAGPRKRKPHVKKEENDYPPKPKSSGYSLFSTVLIHEGKSMKEIGGKWKELSAEEKQTYNRKVEMEKEGYLSQLQLYAEEHPDNEEIKGMIAEEERKRKSGRRKALMKTKVETGLRTISDWVTATAVKKQPMDDTMLSDSEDSEDDFRSSKRKPSETKNAAVASTGKVTSPKKRKHDDMADTAQQPVDGILSEWEDAEALFSSPKKHKPTETTNAPVASTSKSASPKKAVPSETISASTSSVTASPKKRKHVDVPEDEVLIVDISPKKAKKAKKTKVKKQKSGEDLFTEKKYEEYRLTHPDMGEEDMKAKLRKKFGKLKEHKKQKYEKMADEWNESQ